MTGRKIIRFLIHLLIIILVVLLVYPFVIMVLGSFKNAAELSNNPAGIPRLPSLDNYIRLYNFNGGLMVRTFLNSTYVTLVYIVLTLIISAMAAFAFSKYKFKGKDVMFVLLLSTMMVPRELLIPPLYILFSKIGWINTYSVQIFPDVASVFGLFMLRQFMLNIPDSLVEAARIDGAGHLKIFGSIILPVSVPALGALSILLFTNKWNDFLWPVIMVNKPKLMPIMVLLPNLSDNGDVQSVPWELVLTGCTIVTIPIIIIFLAMQDKVMSSVTAGAVKE